MNKYYKGEMSALIGYTIFVMQDNTVLLYYITEWNFYHPILSGLVSEGRIFLTKEDAEAAINEL